MSSHRPRAKAVEPWHIDKLIPAMIECRRHAIDVMRQIEPSSEDYRVASDLNASIVEALKRFSREKAGEFFGMPPSMTGFMRRVKSRALGSKARASVRRRGVARRVLLALIVR